MQNNRFMNTAAATSSQIDVGLRAYMLGVYNHMTTALLLTGFFAYATKMLATTTGPDGQMYLTPLGSLLFNTPLQWVVMLAPLGMVFWLSARIQAMSASKARNMFYLYGAMMGVALSSVLMVYTGASVARAFFITAGAFAGLSLYGYTTKADLTKMGSFLIMGLIGIIVASLINLFIGSSAMAMVISILGVVIFTGLTAWDTQRIKSEYFAYAGHEMAAKMQVMGALSLYLNFINMFTQLIK